MTDDRTVNERLGALESGQDEIRSDIVEIRSDIVEIRSDIADLKDGQGRLERAVASLDGAVASIRRDIGPLKAAHARQGALHASAQICMDLGLDEIRILAGRDIAGLVRRADTTGIARNELDSFIGADVVIEAVDDGGETQYVAVEASFTADERDTDRAMRNAGFLTRFTGKTAHAVVAASRIDDRIAGVIASGKVHWRRLEDRDLQTD